VGDAGIALSLRSTTHWNFDTSARIRISESKQSLLDYLQPYTWSGPAPSYVIFGSFWLKATRSPSW